MKVLLSILLLLLTFVGCPGSGWAKQLPKDVAVFKAKRDRCDHFRGEEPYDAGRKRFLVAQVMRHCTGSDARLKALRKKYKRHPAIVDALAAYDDRIE